MLYILRLKKILNLFDEVWAVSEFIKDRVDELDNTNDKVKVLYNTIDYSLFSKKITLKEKEELKKEYNASGDFIFLYVGRVMREKGTLELVQAFSNVNREFDNIK